jgi:hypothetical protein
MYLWVVLGDPIVLPQIWFKMQTFQTKSNGCAMPSGLQPPTLAIRSGDPSGYLSKVWDILAPPVACPGAPKLGDLA